MLLRVNSGYYWGVVRNFLKITVLLLITQIRNDVLTYWNCQAKFGYGLVLRHFVGLSGFKIFLSFTTQITLKAKAAKHQVEKSVLQYFACIEENCQSPKT